MAGCSLEEARLVVRLLAGLQAQWWGRGRPWTGWTGCPLKTADVGVYRETYSRAWSMLARKAGDGMPNHLAGVAGRLEAHIPAIRGRLSGHPPHDSPRRLPAGQPALRLPATDAPR